MGKNKVVVFLNEENSLKDKPKVEVGRCFSMDIAGFEEDTFLVTDLNYERDSRGVYVHVGLRCNNRLTLQ